MNELKNHSRYLERNSLSHGPHLLDVRILRYEVKYFIQSRFCGEVIVTWTSLAILCTIPKIPNPKSQIVVFVVTGKYPRTLSNTYVTHFSDSPLPEHGALVRKAAAPLS